MKHSPTPKVCAAEGCDASFVPHRWAPENKPESGWFNQRDRVSWCPLHIPEWVAGWRAQRAAEALTGFETLRALYVAHHEDNCTDSACDCEETSATQARKLHRQIIDEYEARKAQGA